MQTDMKFSCLTVDSIRLMSEAAGLPELSDNVATLVSEDTAFKLKLIITRALKFMKRSNRFILSCSDINRALRWSDCQPLFGYECNPNRTTKTIYSEDAHVFTYDDTSVDLARRYKQQPRAEHMLTDETLQEALPELNIEDLSMITEKLETEPSSKNCNNNNSNSMSMSEPEIT